MGLFRHDTAQSTAAWVYLDMTQPKQSTATWVYLDMILPIQSTATRAYVDWHDSAQSKATWAYLDMTSLRVRQHGLFRHDTAQAECRRQHYGPI